MTSDPPPDNKIPDLLPFERKLLVTVIIGAFGVGTLGLLASFDTVGQQAQEWGFHPFWILPVAVDIAIPVFSLAHLLLIRADMPLGWVRAVPWALTAVTVYLNISAARDGLAPQIGHGSLPLLWVVCSEIAAHVYRALIGAVTGRRMERVRKSRWILDPFSTARLWRRMVLWEVTSYRTGLRLESQRLMARAELKDKHGRGWRRKTTMVQRVRLRMGETAPAGVPELMAAPGPVQEALELEQVAGADIVPDPEPELELEPEPYLEEPVGIPMELERELELLNRNWNFEPEPERVEPEPEPELPSELEPEPEPEQPEPEPRTGTANITDRATKKKAQVRQVMELLEQFGIDGVDLKVIKTHHPEIPRTTAHHRLKEAKAEWNRNKARVPNASDLFDLELEPSTGTGT